MAFPSGSSGRAPWVAAPSREEPEDGTRSYRPDVAGSAGVIHSLQACFSCAMREQV
jgi:hypothetical protein